MFKESKLEVTCHSTASLTPKLPNQEGTELNAGQGQAAEGRNFFMRENGLVLS